MRAVFFVLSCALATVGGVLFGFVIGWISCERFTERRLAEADAQRKRPEVRRG